MKITFYGATDTVTGSRFLVEGGGTRILVDCGMFQGVKAIRSRNWDPLPVSPDALDGVALTHAHIDHSGLIPVLTRKGRFRGKVYCTPSTRDLAAILLPDSGHLHEEEAAFLNRIGTTRHQPALPLYTSEDGRKAMAHFEAVSVGEPVKVGGLELRFTRVGHILGAASVHIRDGTRSVSFSGDVGRPQDPLLYPPEPLPDADVLVVESTYGNRSHPPVDVAGDLEAVVNKTAERKGVLLIPAFAVGRAQLVMHYLAELMEAGRIPRLPVYLDSPMAIAATEVFLNHADAHRLDPAQARALAALATPTPTADDSRAITHQQGPHIVISASGMATGGRILHHLVARLSDRRNTVLFVGYQAPGTRGEALVSGAREIKIHGAYHPVEAEIRRIDALSAHADGDELVAWLRHTKKPEVCHLVHGEAAGRDAMRRLLRDRLGWNTHMPEMGETWEV